MPAGQKRAPDLIRDDCELPCGCWEFNSGLLDKQVVLLTAEPPLQPILNSKYGRALIQPLGDSETSSKTSPVRPPRCTPLSMIIQASTTAQGKLKCFGAQSSKVFLQSSPEHKLSFVTPNASYCSNSRAQGNAEGRPQSYIA